MLAARLQGEGAREAYDPSPRSGRRNAHGRRDVRLGPRAVEGADAAVIVTEWPEFGDLDLAEVKGRMANPVIVDGRNMLTRTT